MQDSPIGADYYIMVQSRNVCCCLLNLRRQVQDMNRVHGDRGIVQRVPRDKRELYEVYSKGENTSIYCNYYVSMKIDKSTISTCFIWHPSNTDRFSILPGVWK